MAPRFARRLVALHPYAWRERYGDEMLALIEDTGLSWRVAFDLLLGCAGAWWRELVAPVPTSQPIGVGIAAALWRHAVPRLVVFFVLVGAITATGASLAVALRGRRVPDWTVVNGVVLVILAMYFLRGFRAWIRLPLDQRGSLLSLNRARYRRWEPLFLIVLAVVGSALIRESFPTSARESWLARVFASPDFILTMWCVQLAFRRTLPIDPPRTVR